jgi:hypothetical protein
MSDRTTSKTAKTTKPKTGMFFLFLMLIAGVSLGTVAVILSENTEIFKQYMVHGGLLPEKGGLIHNFVYYSSSILIFVSFMFVFGFCAIGQPATLAFLILRGFSIGCAVSCLYMEFGKSAITEALTLIVPFAVLSGFVMILAARESIKFSNYFAAYAIKNESSGGNNFLKLYLIKYFVILVMLAILIFIQSLVLSIF